MSNFTSTLLILPAIAMLAASCSTTGLGRSWAAPDAQAAPFTKLAVVTLTKQEVYRIQAEDALVAEMTNGVASHTLLPGLNSLRDTSSRAWQRCARPDVMAWWCSG